MRKLPLASIEIPRLSVKDPQVKKFLQNEVGGFHGNSIVTLVGVDYFVIRKPFTVYVCTLHG